MRRTLLLISTLAVSNGTFAGGFSLIEEGASGLGNAYAGAAAVSHDASTVWFNPAGMTELKEKQFIAAGHVIDVRSDFFDQGTTLNSAFGGGFLDPGFANASPVDASGTTFIPNLYYVQPLRGGLTLGIGFSVPYGNSTDFDPTWVGRYQATESEVAALDINPSIAYRVNDQLSIGGGFSVQAINASLGTAVDSSAVCLGLAAAGAVSLVDCAAAGLAQPGNVETDGVANVEGDDVSFTFNLGLLWKPRVGTKLGLAFRSGVDHELEGDAEFTTNAALAQILATAQVPLFQDVGVTADANLPPTLMFSVSHQATDRLELLADVTFTGWSTLEELRVEFDNPAQPDTFNTLAFDDVFRYSAGINYEFSDRIILRAGIAFDEDSVPSPQLRTPRIPGNDRFWTAVGLGYQHNENIGFDVGFANLMLDDSPLANVSEAAGGTTTRGIFESVANILSAQVTVQFD